MTSVFDLTARLYSSDDAMVWAEEFCKEYDGMAVSTTDDAMVDPGLMVGWFANAMWRGEVSALKRKKPWRVRLPLLTRKQR